MSDNREHPDQLEAMRLEVERARLAIDRENFLNERTRTYLERWRTEVQPLHEGAERSREMAVSFSKQGIQTIFFLNGGALIAFPAFAQLVGTAFRDHVAAALLGIGGFVTGLVLVSLTTLLAYLSMDADAEAIRPREEVVKINLNQAHNPEAHGKEQDRQRAEADGANKKHYRRAVRLRWWAVVLGVGSLVAFVFGAAWAAGVLSAASPQN